MILAFGAFKDPKTLSMQTDNDQAIYKNRSLGAPGWRSRLSVRLQPGHDLAVREFEPASGSGLMAQSLEPVSDSVSPSLCPFPVHALSLSVPKINKR